MTASTPLPATLSFTAKGVQIGPTDKLYYVYTLGNWRILALNSNIEMASGSPQYTFAKNALQNAKAAGQNTILYFHHPLLSSDSDHGWRKSISTNQPRAPRPRRRPYSPCGTSPTTMVAT